MMSNYADMVSEGMENVIMDQYLESLRDESELDDSLLDSNPKGLTSWAERKGYTCTRSAKNELRLGKDDSVFELVVRRVDDTHVAMVEMWDDAPEARESAELTLGIQITDKMGYQLWKTMRAGTSEKNAICTRNMPKIVLAQLLGSYDLDKDMILAFCVRLTSFGTAKFWDKEEIPSEISLFDLETPSYICYAPGELEAIAAAAVDVLKSARDIVDVSRLDMRKFSERLAEISKGIPCTPDIAAFGRKIHGCGLKEYKSAISFSSTVFR